jgi:predicted dehydrogenase
MHALPETLSRRRFLQGTAAAAVGFPLLAAEDKTKKPASDRLTLGFIGMGTMNRGHLGHFLGQKDVQVLAVCDVDTTRREAAKATVEKRYADATKSGAYKGCTAYNDYRDLLKRDDIDAVVIATPDHWHAILAIDACEAKKDVYCEKPLTLTIHEASAMIDAVRKFNRVLQTGSQQRSDREFRTAVEYVRSGRIGKVKMVKVDVGGPSKPCDLPAEKDEPGLDWDRWLGPAPKRPYNSVLSPRGVHTHFPNWRNYREYSGGMMTDWGAHHFDIAQWGLDMDNSGPVEIIPPDDPKADRGVRYLYSNGVEVVHANSGGVLFIGSDGEILVNRGKLEARRGEKKGKPEDVLGGPLTEKDVHLYKSPGHQRDWLNCVRSRKRPLCDVEIGARSVTVCHLGNLAYWHHKKLRWDPKKWEFVDGAGENKWLDRDRREGYQLPKV